MRRQAVLARRPSSRRVVRPACSAPAPLTSFSTLSSSGLHVWASAKAARGDDKHKTVSQHVLVKLTHTARARYEPQRTVHGGG